MKRIFIVGLARSGTTVLQGLLARHPDIYSGPESHLFSKTIPKEKYKRFFFRVNKHRINFVREYLNSINSSSAYKQYNSNKINLDSWCEYLVNTLDLICAKKGKRVWVEKTPMHLHYVDLIQQNFPKTKFLFIVRDPLENIAAIFDASKKYPESFKQNTLLKAVNRYATEIAKIDEFSSGNNSFTIKYEDLVSNTSTELKRIYDFLELYPYFDIYDNENEVLPSLVNKSEEWKKNNFSSLKLQSKLTERLSKPEIQFVIERVSGSCKKLRNLKIRSYFEENSWNSRV